MIVCGADGLAGDPLTRMELTDAALWQAVERVVRRGMNGSAVRGRGVGSGSAGRALVNQSAKVGCLG